MLNFNLLKELYIATAYSTLVRHTLEYATIVWDPYQQYLINNIYRNGTMKIEEQPDG